MRFLSKQTGLLWILSDLAESGPSRAEWWWPPYLRKLREANLVRPAFQLHRGWEITDKGREALKARGRT
ncbi:MAG: hypothetical protein INF93_18845 [Rhodobacter sp.]|jgi:hypothetical protein|nr:hypothetical protein [Rhodobacter sp.]